MNKQTEVTKEGLVTLKSELKNLADVKRPKLVERLAFARSQGDLSENSDYQNASDELEFMDGKNQVYHIVGEWEADPAEKKISHTSPLGQALEGKAAGEKVEVKAPAGKVIYSILKIE